MRGSSLILLILFFVAVALLVLNYKRTTHNKIEFEAACQEEAKQISKLVDFWAKKDAEYRQRNEEIDKMNKERIQAFYEGKIEYYPGPIGPVGRTYAMEIGRTIVHHVGQYYDSNLKIFVQFDVYPDGNCEIKF